MIKNIFQILLVTGICITNVFAQEEIKPRPSPTAIVTMKFEDTYIKVTYSQPHKRGRAIFGDLVPYGEIWRTGANEATEITLTGKVLFGKDTLKAGTYSIFSIPNENEWTIILNGNLGQWGAYNYVEKADVLRMTVPTQKIKEVVYEPFTITFEQQNEKGKLVMMWDTTKVEIPITFLD